MDKCREYDAFDLFCKQTDEIIDYLNLYLSQRQLYRQIHS